MNMMILSLIYLALIIAIAGAFGGYISEGSDAKAGKFRSCLTGIAGAFVAIMFASGPFEYPFDEIHAVFSGKNDKDFDKFAFGLIKLFGVSILGGYLGVRLIDRISGKMLSENVNKLTSRMNEVKGEVDIENSVRKASDLVDQGLPEAAWDKLKELPPVARPEDLAWLRLWRGYVRKRMGMLDEAKKEVEESLKIKESFDGWYNHACYIALAHAESPTRGAVDGVRQSLEKAEQVARTNRVSEKFLAQLKSDTETNGDLYSLRDKNFIRELLQ